MKKIYVITGATSGIGKALTEHFSKYGTVFAGYRNEEKIKELPANVIPFYIDATNSDSIKQATDFIKSKTQKIDTLINVAGCVVAGAMEYIAIDEIRRQFEVNVFSHLDFTQQLLDQLEGGKIINISSMSSFGIFPYVAPYCASKRSLDIMFNALQVETKRNIKVISIKPGVIATPLWGKSIKENQDTLSNCKGYDSEMKYMVANAHKNEIKGLSVQKVVNTIIKADNSKKPRTSYLVGVDAKRAQILSLIPEGILNTMTRFFIKHISKK